MGTNQIQSWEEVEAPQATDPYDNHADVRASLEGHHQAMPQSADQVFDSVMETSHQATQTATVLSEAIKRIEQAKLYETLLKHDMFGAGSARPEIMEAVQNEIRAFALNRLEVLLGMKSAVEQPQPVQVKSPFSEEEVAALRALASRMIQRDAPPREANPQIVPIQAQESSATPLNAIRPLAQKMIADTRTPGPTVPDMPPGPAMLPPQPAPVRRPRRSQAVNPQNRPVKMPSNDQMNAMNAVTAAKAEQAMGGSVLGTAVSLSKANAAKNNEGE